MTPEEFSALVQYARETFGLSDDDIDQAFHMRYGPDDTTETDDTLILDMSAREQFAARMAETRKRQGNES